MAGTRRVERLAGSLGDRLRLPAGDLVVALSGGADSAALAMLCRNVGREVRALHVNHGLPNSPMMESAARTIADQLDVELKVLFVDVPQGASPEGQARRARYSAFAEGASASALLTAHTMDDQVETVVFNMVRGTGARGLAGIPPFRRPNVYRPILGLTRSETRELAVLAGLPFVDDPMNDDLSLSRNVIRSRIIPVLEELNPRLTDSIARLAASIAEDNDYLEATASGIEVIVDGSSARVAIGDLYAVPDPIRDRVLKELISRSIGSHAVTAERVQRIREVAAGSAEGAQLGEGSFARRSGAHLVVRFEVEEDEGHQMPLEPGLVSHRGIRYEMASFDRVCLVAPLSKWQAIFPVDVSLAVDREGTVTADGVPAWVPGVERLPVAFYDSGTVGYLSVRAFEEAGWTSSR